MSTNGVPRCLPSSSIPPKIRLTFETPPVPHEAHFHKLRWNLEPVRLTDPLKSSKHIRLLLLDEWQKDCAQHVHCEVFQVPIETLITKKDQPPKFAALSYRWGTGTENMHITCGHDRVRVAVRNNLWCALNRSKFNERKRLLWADALCINQDDNGEKSAQVPLMSKIYENAHVCVWLGFGESFKADEQTIRFLELLWHAAESVWSDAQNVYRMRDVPVQHVRASLARAARMAGVPNMYQLPWLGLFIFSNNEYFKRLWIVQELVLARSHEIMFGVWSHSFSVYYQAIKIAYRIQQERLDPNSTRDPCTYLIVSHTLGQEPARDLVQSQQNTRFIFRLAKWGPDPEGFPPENIALWSRQKCRDPRDKVHGLTALSKAAKSFLIDYNLTPREVFAHFSLYCIQHTNCLHVFSIPKRAHSIADPQEVAESAGFEWLEGLPSRCVDWSALVFLGPMILGFRCPWLASGTSKVQVTSTSQLLGLIGKVVGVIEASAMSDVFNGDAGTESVLMKLVMTIPASKLLLAFVETTLTLGGSPSPLEFLVGSEDGGLKRIAVAWASYYAPTLLDKTAFRRPRGRRGMRKWLAQALQSRVRDGNSNMAMFATADGRLGSGMDGLQKGDQICVLYGGQTPYILRPHADGKHYTFISDAYVSGLMNGEALELGLPDQEFLLRVTTAGSLSSVAGLGSVFLLPRLCSTVACANQHDIFSPYRIQYLLSDQYSTYFLDLSQSPGNTQTDTFIPARENFRPSIVENKD